MKKLSQKCVEWAKDARLWCDPGQEIKGEWVQDVYTYSAHFMLPNEKHPNAFWGEVVSMPEPGEGWEKIKTREYWLEWEQRHLKESDFLLEVVRHESGQCWLQDMYRILISKNAKYLTWTKWRKQNEPDPPIEKPEKKESYEKKFPLMAGECDKCGKPLKECECKNGS